MAMIDETKFRAFIKAQLKIAKINQEHREAFTDPAGMQLFLAAVTHPTYNSENNYQELEFIGDGIIKGILSQYIPRRFPKLASGGSKYSKKGTGEGVLSKTRRFLEQRKTLSDFALKLGFWDFVLADEETKTKLRKETLEDVFEAFVGALVEIVDLRVKRGLGYNYAYNYVEASLDNMEIEISKKTLDDPITRLNELYKANDLKGSNPPLKWGDAAYFTETIYFPKLAYKPKNAMKGDVFFSTKDKVAYVYDGTGWVHISRAPLVNLLDGACSIFNQDGSQTKRRLVKHGQSGASQKHASNGKHLLLTAGQATCLLFTTFMQDRKHLINCGEVLLDFLFI